MRKKALLSILIVSLLFLSCVVDITFYMEDGTTQEFHEVTFVNRAWEKYYFILDENGDEIAKISKAEVRNYKARPVRF